MAALAVREVRKLCDAQIVTGVALACAAAGFYAATILFSRRPPT